MQSRLTTSPENAAAPPPTLNPDLDAVCACSFGGYPWDDWERHALASGLDADLAGLGRLLIREAFNHSWESWLQHRCGWGDDGRALLALALRAPKAARLLNLIQLKTRSGRGRPCSFLNQQHFHRVARPQCNRRHEAEGAIVDDPHPPRSRRCRQEQDGLHPGE